ncbi:MAG: hydrogenase, partial [Lentisphaerae bacterium]|nr:hydrogenase [Lentisphaerota bacterium]
MPIAAVFIALLLLPLVVAGLTLFCRRPLAVLRLLQVGVVLEALLIALAVATYMLAAPSGQLVWHWFMLDALSVYHLLIMALVFLLGTAFVDRYFAGAIAEGSLTLAGAHKFAGLWLGALCSMVLVLISNNLGILWVGIEATTLMTAFLVCTHISAASLEAMWKYLVICSIGVACAFMGTLLVAAAAQPLCLGAGEELLWIQLWNNAAGIDEPLLQLGFLFLVVGYGTKAGLAPLHNWLPDAHS